MVNRDRDAMQGAVARVGPAPDARVFKENHFGFTEGAVDAGAGLGHSTFSQN
jgi:hypothetical protein